MKNISRDALMTLLETNVPNLNDKILYIYGGGYTARLFQEGLKREFFYDQIAGYCESNPEKWGTFVFGKPCINPQELKGKENVLVLICTPQKKFIDEIREKLNSLEINNFLLEEAILKNHANEILEIYDSLYDEKSKNIYANLAFCRITGNSPDFDLFSYNQYFCWNEFTAKDTGTIFVDCGAYVGDSMEQYIWYKQGVVDKIICFEPDQKNLAALYKRIGRLKNEWNLTDEQVTVLPYGLSNKKLYGKMLHNAKNNGLGSSIMQNKEGKDGDSIEITTIDNIINENIGYLKADIEGFEYNMLRGAARLIQNCKPCISVCIYHNSTDFYSVPLLVKKMMPDANIVVRHHSNNLSETVLYAWVD